MKLDLPDFFESNMACLKANHPEIYLEIDRLHFVASGGVELSQQGKLNYFVESDTSKRIYLHDKDDPEAEIPHFLNLVPQDATGIVIMLGMGLGYTPVALLKQRPNIRNLIVFELDPHVFVGALRHRDLKIMLEDPRLVLNIGNTSDIAKFMERFQVALQLETIYTLNHNMSFDFNPDGYNKLYEALYTVVNNYNVGGATALAFGDKNLANRFDNLSVMVRSHIVASLEGKFKGVPAFLVAGGPSLNKNIHLLSLVKGRGLLFCVDSVLPALVSHDIYPDFLGAIDPESITWEKIADYASIVKDKKISLLCLDSVTPLVPKRFPSEKIFWMFTGKKLSSWLNTLLGGSLLTAGAGTVAHLNLLSAVIMGCSPIVFVGQDLAFSEGKSHVENTVLTNNEQLEEIDRRQKDMILVKGIDGGTVKTNRGFACMKEFFERVVRDHPGIYINATEGGVHIEGSEVLTLKDTLKRYCHDPCQGIIQDQLSSLPEPDFRMRSKAIVTDFKEIMKKIKSLRSIIRRAERLIHECIKKINKKNGNNYVSFDDLPETLKKKLKQIDQCNADQDKELGIWQLLDELTMDGLKQSERSKYTIADLENKPEYYETWLIKTLERSSFINGVRIKVLQKLSDPLEYIVNYLGQEDLLEPYSMDRVRLFLDDHYYALAAPLLKKIEAKGVRSAELKFSLGMVAAVFVKYAVADAYFAEAVSLDPLISKQISKFRKNLGDLYLSYSQRKDMDRRTDLYMLLKGLQYCRDHKQIKKELKEMAISDLKVFDKGIDYGHADMIKPSIELWYEMINEDADVLSFLENPKIALFCLYFAKLAFDQDRLHRSKDALEKALAFDKNNPDIHAMLAKIFFELQEFENGVGCLNAAVALDSSYGKLWETLGDKMLLQKHYGDALAAYEQLFQLNPERADILRKIGDCYLAIDQIEAARDVYYQVKLLLNGNNKA